MPLRRFIDLPAPRIAEVMGPDTVLVLPLGAVEQHGPHLPLATDYLVAKEVAEAAVAQAGEELDLWLLEPLAYTKSNEHAWSPGTVWLSHTTLMAVLDDLGRSLATTPAKRLVFVNGHGGNSALLQVAARELRLAYGLRTFVVHPGTPADQGGASPTHELGMGVHGGTDETSVMLHLRPDLVDMSKAQRWVPEELAEYRYIGFGKKVAFGWTSDDFGPSGVIGDPTHATAERGKELFELAVTALVESLEEIRRFTPPGTR